MIRSIVLAFILTATAMGGGYLLGRDLGRADLAGECADVGIFTLYDEGSERHKTFHCFEIGGGEPASRPEPEREPKGFSA
jgi:hypothetical protein